MAAGDGMGAECWSSVVVGDDFDATFTGGIELEAGEELFNEGLEVCGVG